MKNYVMMISWASEEIIIKMKNLGVKTMMIWKKNDSKS